MATAEVSAPRALRDGGFLPIGGYAAIGDGHTAALVGVDGSIDWLCLPTFSDASVFAAVLDPARGGRFALEPAVPYTTTRRYLPGTNVLETTFSTASGTVRVTDAMALAAVGLLAGTQLIRRIEWLAGEVPMRWLVDARFGYGQVEPRIERTQEVVVARAGEGVLAIQAFGVGDAEIRGNVIRGEATAREGERGLLALTTAHRSPVLFETRASLDERVDATAELWRRWVAGSGYEGPWREHGERSLLALKLLVYEPSGAVVAAPTTSLPERIGGDRNYDYRFAWTRDASFAVDAALRIGMREEAHRAFTWLLHATSRTHPRLQPVYRIDGRPPSGVRELDLAGYRGSRPVQSGNGASGQTQLGTYGDLFATTWLYVAAGGTLDPETGGRLAQVADIVCDVWPAVDSGIWELDDKRNYTQSKMACWVALERASKLAERGEITGAGSERWRAARDEIRRYVTERCWSQERGCFKRDAESDELDVGTVLAARMEFVDPRGDELAGTIAAIRRELDAGWPLVYRYSGMREQEGAFAPCSFWIAEALARAGRTDEAAEMIERMLAYANDVGLFSEEIDPSSGELRGNFPQGLTHQAFLNACASLSV